MTNKPHPRAAEPVDDLPLFAFAKQRRAETERLAATVSKSRSERTIVMLTVREDESVDARELIEGTDGTLQPRGEAIAVNTSDSLAELLGLFTARRRAP
jgi:hypothetical protein